MLQTETTQVGTQINPQTIDHTALISRNPVALTLPWVNNEGKELTCVPAPTWIGSPAPVVPRFW